MDLLGRWLRSKEVQAVGVAAAAALLTLVAHQLAWFETLEHRTLTREGQASRGIVISEVTSELKLCFHTRSSARQLFLTP